jgi:hypothetical protein
MHMCHIRSLLHEGRLGTGVQSCDLQQNMSNVLIEGANWNYFELGASVYLHSHVVPGKKRGRKLTQRSHIERDQDEDTLGTRVKKYDLQQKIEQTGRRRMLFDLFLVC